MRNLAGLTLLALAGLLLWQAPARAYQPGGASPRETAGPAGGGVVLSAPELLVTRDAGIESLQLAGEQYQDFKLEGRHASFLIPETDMGSGAYEVPGSPGQVSGIKNVSWSSSDAGVQVELEFAHEPRFSVINIADQAELRPDTTQVIAAFAFAQAGEDEKSGPSRSSQPPVASEGRRDDAGDYELPKFKDYKYSDALVTLRANNVDFREVLWLFSRIGNVSIMLDPYWQTEPTGTRRPPGGGVQAGGGGAGGGGFRSGGEFGPIGLTEGAGQLSFNFIDVPFDTALDLVIKSVGLVYVDIEPQGEGY